MRLAGMILALGLAACGPTPPADPAPSDESAPVVVGPNMTVSEWRAATPDLQATYFRGTLSAYITDEAQNETQREFDDNLALDLRDCVIAELEKDTPGDTDSIRPFITRCLAASGIPAPG